MRAMSRRGFLALSATVAVGTTTGRPAAAGAASSATPPSRAPLAADPFGLGIAAGDPDGESVVLWTRLMGDGLPERVPVVWEVANDETFAEIAAAGEAVADAAEGHSVHVIAPFAGPGCYRFRAGGFTSPVGRAAPTPDQATELRIAAASCQHFETGYYAAHRDVAEWAPDLVVFLGDFIYEGAGRPVDGPIVRTHDGPEAADLAGYRARYARYLGDADLRAARAACPWLVIWDDHEVENNYAGLVPQDPAEAASFAARRDAAYRAWWEHMPVRSEPPVPGAPFDIARVVGWGGLADLVLVDGRQFRDDQACGDATFAIEPPCPEALDPARSLLGDAQEAWVGAALESSTATWPTLCQPVVMTDLRIDGAILNHDQWDGYSPARDRLLTAAAAADRLIVLTGDIHLAGVGVLPDVGVEFVTTSVSSQGNIDPSLQPVLDSFPAVVASELLHRGYTRHVVTPERWTAEYRVVDDVADPASAVSTWRTFHVEAAARDQVVAVDLPAGD